MLVRPSDKIFHKKLFSDKFERRFGFLSENINPAAAHIHST
jgi:hypothetical protein